MYLYHVFFALGQGEPPSLPELMGSQADLGEGWSQRGRWEVVKAELTVGFTTLRSEPGGAERANEFGCDGVDRESEDAKGEVGRGPPGVQGRGGLRWASSPPSRLLKYVPVCVYLILWSYELKNI